MKKFLVQNIYMLVLLILIFVSLCYLVKSTSSKAYLLECIDKERIVANVKGPKIVFIGGSNLAFGLNSQMIRDSLSIFPVNMGVHAGLGLHYMMQEVEVFMKRGDILVIVPEYGQFLNSIFYGESILTGLLLMRGEYLEIIHQCSSHLRNIPKVWMSLFLPGDLYFRNQFNQYGDYTGHWTLPPKHVMDFKEEGIPEEGYVKQVAMFINQMQNRGVKCFIYPPAMKKKSAKLSLNYIYSVEKLLNSNGIPFEKNTERYFFQDSLFYDTRYHLTKQGADMRTQYLIEDLKESLFKYKEESSAITPLH